MLTPALLPALNGGAIAVTAPDSITVLVVLSGRCPACRIANRVLVVAGQRARQDGAALRVVVVGNRPEAQGLEPLYRELAPLLEDSTGIVLRHFGLNTVPAVVVLGPRGTLMSAMTVPAVGYMDADSLTKVIRTAVQSYPGANRSDGN